MIVLNKAFKDVHLVDFFNLKSKAIINRFISLGNGPEEMLNTLAHVRNNELFVHDFAKNQIGMLNIDSILYNPEYRMGPPTRFSNNVGSSFVTFYNKNEVIMQNPYYFSSVKLEIDNEMPRFIVSEAGDVSKGLSVLDNVRYFTYNVSQGSTIPNLKNNRIIYASSFLNELGIYDMDFNPIKLILTPDDLEPKYRFDEDNQIVFDRVAPYAYRGHCVDDNYFYVSYVGDYFSVEKHLKEFSSWIFKFDWNGTLIDSLMSGAKSEVRVKFEAEEKGVFFKIISIYYAGGNSPLEVAIKGEVR